MAERGTERAVRIADLMQTIARLIVLVIIIPSAILLATFFILEPVIPDFIIRSLVSGVVGSSIAGLLIVKTGRPYPGFLIVFISTILAGVAIILSFPTLYMVIFSVHLSSIVSYLILRNLSNLNLLERRWVLVKSLVGLLVVVTGPLTVTFFLITLGFTVQLVLLYSLITTSLYALVIHIIVKNPILGVVNSLLLAMLPGTYVYQVVIAATLDPNIILQLSAFTVGFGTGLLFFSQILRRFQNYLLARPFAKTRLMTERERILDMLGIPLESGAAEEEIEVEPELPEEWLIHPNHGQVLSGIAMIGIASGIPAIFLLMAFLTEWGLLATFDILFIPIAILLSLLVLAPSPVFLRLGDKIRRSQETLLVRILGSSVVLISALTVFFWTQHFLWPFLYSAITSIFLFLSGITGLYKEIRRAWKLTWNRFVHQFRKLKEWVRTHPVHSGLAANFTITLFVVLQIYPIVSGIPNFFLSLSSIALIVFSLVALIGLAALKKIPKRSTLLSVAWITLLGSSSVLTFWYLNEILFLDFISSINISLLWCLGFSILQKIGVHRSKVALPYLVGSFAATILIWQMESLYLQPLFPIVTLFGFVILQTPILYAEYLIALSITYNALIRVGTRIRNWLIRFGSVAKRVLVRVGGAIYRAIIAFVVLLTKFILISYAAVIFFLLIYFGYNTLYLVHSIDALLILFVIGSLFFLAYAPLLNYKKRKDSPLMTISLIGIAICAGGAFFVISPDVVLILRCLISFAIISSMLTLFRGWLPERIRFGLPSLTWISVLTTSVAYLFLIFTPINGELVTGLGSSVLFGIGLLPLKRMSVPSKYVNIGYGIFTILQGTFLSFLITQNFLIAGIILVLLPIPVAHKQYTRAISVVASVLVLGLKVILAFIAINLVIAFGAIGFAVGILSLQYLQSFLVFAWIPPFSMALGFVIIVLAILLPALLIRKSENPLLLSGALVILVMCATAFLITFSIPYDPIWTMLVGASILGILLTIVASGITFIRYRKGPLIFTIICFLMIVVYVLPGDLILKSLILCAGLSIFVSPMLSESNRIRFAYPLAIASVLGIIFVYLVLPNTDPLFAISTYVALESLILSVTKRTRSWQIWWVFAVSVGYSLYWVLSPLTPIAPLAVVLVVVELIRLTPDIEYQFSEYHTYFGIFRAIALSVIAAFWLWPYNILIALEVATFLLLVVLAISLRSVLGNAVHVLIGDASAILIGALVLSYLQLLHGFDLIISIYIWMIPVVLVFWYRSDIGPYKIIHWSALSFILTASISASWYLFYQTVESILLVIPTAFLIASLCWIWDPETGARKEQSVKLPAFAFILFIESIWIWHASIILLLPLNAILFVASAILLTTLIFPAIGSMSWMEYEDFWDIIAIVVAITTGSFISGWNFTTLTLPINPILTLGWILSCYSLVSTPVIVAAESAISLPNEERICHLTWIPALPGWALLGYELSRIVTIEPMIQLGFAGLGFSIAALVFVALQPERSAISISVGIMLLSTSLAYVFWFMSGVIEDPALRLLVMVVIWYVVSIPVLAIPTIAAAILIFGALKRFASWIDAVIKRNMGIISITIPIIIGCVFGFIFAVMPPTMKLGLYIGHYLQALVVIILTVGILYFIETLVLSEPLSTRLQKPVVLLLGIGAFVLALALTLPENPVSIELLSYYISVGFASMFGVTTVLNRIYKFDAYKRMSLMLFGIALAPVVTLGLVIFAGFWIVHALLIALVVTFVIEIPILEKQIRAFIAILENLGVAIANALRRLGEMLRYFFNRFGYVMWTLFSLVFTVTLGLLTFPFFSDLIGMNISGLLYLVPSVSVPIGLLGLLLLTVAIARRKVRSRFGLSAVLVTLAGLGTTLLSWLFDFGYPYVAILSGIIAVCCIGLLIDFETFSDAKRRAILWIPIPLALAGIVFRMLTPVGAPFDHILLSLGIVLMIVSCLFLASGYSDVLPTNVIVPMWLVLAFTAGGLSFIATTIAMFPLLASMYLAVFIISWTLLPVVAKNMRHLFYAPLFFSLTGFAFTFVFGELYQGLLLALAAFLLFISLFIREREKEHPKLVYVRILVLLLILVSVILFGVSMVSPLIVI